MEKQKSNEGAIYIGKLFLLLGIAFMIVSTVVRIHTENFIKNAGQTTAMITNIESRFVRERYNGKVEKKLVHDVYVSYEVDGEWYNEKLNAYDSSMSEGKEIEIYYSKEKPNEIMAEYSPILSWVFFGVGTLMSVVGLFLWVLWRKKDRPT